MSTTDELARRLTALDGKGYNAYRSVKGRYRAGRLDLLIDHVQGDPFAQPSRLRALVPPESADFPEWTRSTADRRDATADFLTRALRDALRARSRERGSGRSGELSVLRAGQQVLRRTAMLVGADGEVEARFRVGLPAKGRRILGREAAAMVMEGVLPALGAALLFEALDSDALRRHVHTVEDARALRAQLEPRGLVAFVADGARLPRRSGIDDRPLAADRVVPFATPESLRVTLEAPNAGAIAGMGVPEGVTLIVGGGFHGKSTLLRAIERGVYDHVPGDGRERVVTVSHATKVRAEDGRAVAGTDISNFIGRLPGGEDTRRFVTENASGSTSQAAAIVEALEAGTRCLLLDEDTSATNFMIRDARMQALIEDEHEPITPFIDRARQLAEDEGISTVLVVGGSGDYFDTADTVVAMRDYSPAEVTAAAREVAERYPTLRRQEGGGWAPIAPRVPLPGGLDPSKGWRDRHIRTRSANRVVYGTQEVDLSAVEQIAEPAQLRAMAEALAWARGGPIDGLATAGAAVREIVAAIERDGLDAVQTEPAGELADFRAQELIAFLSRIRTLETRG